MKRTISIILLTMCVIYGVSAQTSKAEQEILKIHKQLDEAYLKKDMATFERILADDYVYSDPTAKMMNRVQSLEEMRREFANTSYKTLEVTSNDLKVKVSGKIAIITGNWEFTASPANSDGEPHKDSGRYTGVYEKRNGKWLLIAEHFSEAPHDRQVMEEQVLKIGQEYVEMIKNQDAEAIEKLLAEEYLYTNDKGKVKNKAEDIADYKTAPVKFERFELSEQKVRVIGNGVAVETGIVSYKGTDSDGKPFEGRDRYTTTWTWRGFRWQIVADHTSEIK